MLLRFALGGSAVVACYLVSVFSPVKFIGGVFAAFPAVMAAAVIMAGMRDGDREAAEVARGAVSGMIGCTACVLAALFLIRSFNSWSIGLTAAVGVWLIVAIASNYLLRTRQ